MIKKKLKAKNENVDKEELLVKDGAEVHNMASKRSGDGDEAESNGTGESVSRKKRNIPSFTQYEELALIAEDNCNRQSYQMEEIKLEKVRVELEEWREIRAE